MSGRSRGRLARGLVASAVVLAMSVPLVAAPAASAVPASPAGGVSPGHQALHPFARIGRAAVQPPGARIVGVLPASEQVAVDVVLQPRSAAGLARAAEEVSSPKSRFHRDYLTPAEFADLFAPAPTTVARVSTQLAREGLSVGAPEDHGMLLPVRASASTAAAAFHTKLLAVRLADGTAGRMAVSAPALPAAIAPDIAGVVGLNDLGAPQPLGLGSQPMGASALRGIVAGAASRGTAGTSGGPGSCAAANTTAFADAGYTPNQIAHAYGFDGLYGAGDLGAGQTVDVFELEPFEMTDVATFDECLFGRSHTSQITIVPIDGVLTDGSGSGEAALDVEEISALAPAADVDVYEAPQNFTSWLDETVAIVSQDRAPVVSTSWGLCEQLLSEEAPGFQQAENIFLEQAALEGQSWFAASGDSGSEGCNRSDPYLTGLMVSDPASQPFVTGVGATEILDPSDPPTEVAWNDGGQANVGVGLGASGGGISSLWPMPPWQSGLGAPGVQNSYSSGAPCGAAAGVVCREVPDVSANGDELHGDIIVYQGSFGAIGGTSAAAPKWAAAATVTDALCAAEHVAPVGFANPALYQIAANPVTYAEAFNDITAGNNDMLGTNGGAYPATSGYDMATGLGTPRLTSPSGGLGLAGLLCADGSALTPRPVVSGVSPTFGPYQGGTSVTITGSDLTGVTSVDFGTAAVPVIPSQVVDGGTQIDDVVTPSSSLAPILGGVPVGGVLVTVGGGAGASEPSPAAEFHFIAENPSSDAVPGVSFVGPSAGSSAGGSLVTIIGSGFEEGPYTTGTKPTIEFGSVAVPAADVTVVSDSELSVVVPAETGATDCATAPTVPTSSICQVEVTVGNANGTSAVAPIYPAPTGLIILTEPPGIETVAAATEFDYAPAPTVTSESPSVLPEFPNTFDYLPPLVTLVGSGFNLLTLGVVFGTRGSSDASSLYEAYSIEPDEVQVLFYGLRGVAPVTSFPIAVTTPGGSTAPVTVIAASVPSIASIDVDRGPTTGGTTVNATGSDFEQVTAIAFATGQALFSGTEDFTVHSPTSLTFVTPADGAGPGAFSVCSIAGCSSDSVAFTYYEPIPPTIRAFSPTSGPANGESGNDVLIVGTGLDAVRSVLFGREKALYFYPDTTNFGGESDNELLAGIPPGPAGSSVPITVITAYGSTGPVGSYTYLKSPPAPPQSAEAKAGPGSISVQWAPPASDGGSPIEGYLVIAEAAGATELTSHLGPRVLGATLAPALLGVSYAVTVTVVTALGRASASGGSVTPAGGENGYVVAGSEGAVAGFGSLGGAASGLAGRTLPAPIVGIAGAQGTGYWLAGADGSVYPLGGAPELGSLVGKRLSAPIVGIAAAPDLQGYWLVGADGGVFSFGDAKFHGSLGGMRLNRPIVGILSTPDGGGYWLVASDGGVFAFGDARYEGSLGGRHLVAPIVAILAAPQAPDSAAYGYWLVGADGGVFSFGDAKFHGSLGGDHPSAPIVAAVPTPDGEGYWLLGRNGAVYALGSARYEGGAEGLLDGPATGIGL